MTEFAALRAQLAGLRVLAAAIRLLDVIRKANFNPAQLRTPAGQSGGGRWAGDGGTVQLVADKPPPLRRLHADSTYESDQIAKGSLEYWRRQLTDQIVESLKQDGKQPLTVKPDGTISQGNTRIKVLQERGYDVNTLPRMPHDRQSPPPKPPVGRGGGGRRFPRMLWFVLHRDIGGERMDLASKQSWFASQAEPFKILVLLEVMHQLTLVLRDVSTTGDKGLMWRSAWVISECNHRLLGYATAIMTKQPHYPDDVIIEILFDHLGHATLEPYALGVWDRAVADATKFGVKLLR